MGCVGITAVAYVYDLRYVDYGPGRYSGEWTIVLEVVAGKTAFADVPPGGEFCVVWAGG